jgi:hypothetical protein
MPNHVSVDRLLAGYVNRLMKASLAAHQVRDEGTHVAALGDVAGVHHTSGFSKRGGRQSAHLHRPQKHSVV